MSHQIDALGLKILKGAESCRLTAYQDSTGIWTIGWGAIGIGIIKGLVWTQAQADARLVKDLAQLEAEIDAADGNSATNDNQFSAMTDLAYNIGIGNFLKSSVLRFHRAGLHHDAAAAFGAWNRAGGVVLKGLTDRRAAESALYLTAST